MIQVSQEWMNQFVGMLAERLNEAESAEDIIIFENQIHVYIGDLCDMEIQRQQLRKDLDKRREEGKNKYVKLDFVQD